MPPRKSSPGAGLRRAGRERVLGLPAWLAGGAARATPPPPRPCWRPCRTCGPAKTPRTSGHQPAWKPFIAAARRQPRDALRHARAHARPCRRPRDQPRLPALGVAAGRPRRLRTAGHRGHQRAARPARRLPARAPCPDAAGRTRPRPGPARRPATATRPPRMPSPPPSPACASTAPLITSPMACSTRPSTSRRHGDAEAAAAAIDEARAIGRRLRCQPLLDRADAWSAAEDPDAGLDGDVTGPEESAAAAEVRAAARPGARRGSLRAAATGTRCATVTCGCSSLRSSSTRSAAGHTSS